MIQERDHILCPSANSKIVWLAAKSSVILYRMDGFVFATLWCSCTSSGYLIMKIYSKILTRLNSKFSCNKPDKSEYFDAKYKYFFVKKP